MRSLKISWNKTEKTIPNASSSFRGTTAVHRIAEKRRLRSQKKAERMRMMILTGSEEMVRRKRASGVPYAVRAHPKNVYTVIRISFISEKMKMPYGVRDHFNVKHMDNLISYITLSTYQGT